mgnify:CR=1 FL=1
MQTHACSFGICRETVDGGLIELGSRMKEINRLCVRGGGALLEAGDKRRDADARTLRLSFVTASVEQINIGVKALAEAIRSARATYAPRELEAAA